MPHVVFTANLQRHVDCPPQDVVGATVREALEAVFADNVTLRGYIFDEHGQLRKHVMVFHDGRPVINRETLADAVAPDDEIYVMQALSGG